MKSQISRRDFLKTSGGVTGLFAAAGIFRGPLQGLNPPLIEDTRPSWTQETRTICPYDASGCGFICYTEGGNLINLEGDPDHPINQGGGCAKGASLAQLHNNGAEVGEINPWRLQKVLYRAPGASDWEEKSWDFALDRIAQLMKKDRDENWIGTNANGKLVNRTEAIASVGASALDNEECYLLVKMLRAMGLVYIEHHARI